MLQSLYCRWLHLQIALSRLSQNTFRQKPSWRSRQRAGRLELVRRAKAGAIAYVLVSVLLALMTPFGMRYPVRSVRRAVPARRRTARCG